MIKNNGGGKKEGNYFVCYAEQKTFENSKAVSLPIL